MTRSRDVSKGATRNEFIYTATATQTTFSGNDDSSNSLSYTVGQIDVFLNGSRLAPADFTATNGTSVVLDTGADASDTLQINAFGTFSVADVIVDRLEFDYTATAGQTTFTGSDNDSQTMAYTAGRIDVYLNGSHLNQTDDYVATNGTSVVLQAGAEVGDILHVVAHGTVNLASNILSGDLDLAGNELILDADNDTTITADTDDQIDIKIAGADDFAFKANKFEVQTGSNIDMNGTELILDADGDTSITADTDDQIDIRISGADDFAFKANSFEVQTGSNIDMNGTELILDADADTSITADTDDQIDIKVGGSDLATLTDGQLTLTSATASRPGIVLESTNADANPPFLRFQKNGSSPADDDEVGLIAFYADDDGGNVFIPAQIKVTTPDVSDGSENGDISFFTSVDGTSAARFVIDDEGQMLFGGITAELTNNGGVIQSKSRTGSEHCATFRNGVSNGGFGINFQRVDGTQVGSIAWTATATNFNTTSDYRLKENVDYSWTATTRLKQLKPARFNFIEDSDNTLVDGFIAHEVSSVVPEAITGDKDATKTQKNVIKDASGGVLTHGITEADWTAGKAADPQLYPSDSTWHASTDVPDYQSIDQAKLVPLLVKTIQELEARITALES